MEANKAQADYWASPAGLKWIQLEHALDTAMAEMLHVMLDRASITETDRVVDIGCGTGASTLASARRVTSGEAVGVDISKPLLDRAADRAIAQGVENASFLLADAQTHAFPANSFDVLVSRLGMSFFSDTVEALQNLGKGLKDGGRMAFVCWAPVDRNPWFNIPKKAAEERLGAAPKAVPGAPGPTAFQDVDYVINLMSKAGLSNLGADAIDITLTPPGGASGAAEAASRVGPAARIMKAHTGVESDETAIEEAVRVAFEPFDRNGQVRVPAVVNLFTCTA